MPRNLDHEIATLEQLTAGQLRTQYVKLFAEAPRCRHRLWLVRRIAWRLQAMAEGDLSERARLRAAELANDADLRLTAPRTALNTKAQPPGLLGLNVQAAKHRLPLVGSVLTRRYKDQLVSVKILNDGFEFEGQIFGSLSAVVKRITGAHWNGFHFFGLAEKGKKP